MSIRTIEGHTILSKELSEQSVIIDLGANIGRFSHAMLREFNCRCIAVEANPRMSSQIQTHPRLTVRNLAIAAANGILPFYLSANPESSSLLPRATDKQYGVIDVQASRLDEFVESSWPDRIDVIKFDIEGAEIDVIDSCTDTFLQRIPQLTIEFHDFNGLTDESTVTRIVTRLERLGFFYIKMWRYAWGDTLFVNRALTSQPYYRLLWSKHVIRNWRGLARVLSRNVSRVKGEEE
jgi:FkbM family methyltransferase